MGAIFCAHPVAAETLQEALSNAYLINPVLSSERARLRATDEQVSVAKSGLRPNISASGDAAFQNQESDIAGGSRSNVQKCDAATRATEPAFCASLDASEVPPVVLARLAQLASVEATDSVLDIGCATGYSTAILAHLARAVTAVEAEPELAAAARETLQTLGLGNVAVVDGDHARGAPETGPYDVILLNGSVPDVPGSLLAQLKEGGRLVAIMTGGSQERPRQGKAFLFVKVDGESSGLPHFDANARPLPGFAPSPSFTF